MIAKSGFLNDCPIHSQTGVTVSYSSYSSSDGECTCEPEEILYEDIFLTPLEWDVDKMSELIEKKEQDKEEEEDWAPLNRKDRRSRRGREYLKKVNNVEL